MKSRRMNSSGIGEDTALGSFRALIGGQECDPVRLPLLTGSMAPAIMPGDMLIVKPLHGQRAHVGDVAVFIKDGKVTAHRVIFVLRLGNRAFMLEMGDANRHASSLEQNAILGIVDSIERDGERFSCNPKIKDGNPRRIAWSMLIRSFFESLPSERLRRIFRK